MKKKSLIVNDVVYFNNSCSEKQRIVYRWISNFHNYPPGSLKNKEKRIKKRGKAFIYSLFSLLLGELVSPLLAPRRGL